MRTLQPTLPTFRDWSEPQPAAANGLTPLLSEAAKAGFRALVLETSTRPFGYRVTFGRMAGHVSENRTKTLSREL
jgi:hypothetical protein